MSTDIKFNVVCGLPRSGSTLLCNVLNQNPEFCASSTSVLAQMFQSLITGWSNSPEIKSEIIRDKEKTEARLQNTMRAIVHTWYSEHFDEGEVIFDKGRGWNHASSAFEHLFPTGKMIVCIRDPREVFASVEKQDRKFPLLSNDPGNNQYSIASTMFSPTGVIGHCILGVEDMIRRKNNNVVFVQYEMFVSNPDMILDRLYRDLDLNRYEHDFQNVENTANDVDGLYLNKFPHDGSGPIEVRDAEVNRWVGKDIQELIMGMFPFFNKYFGYGG